MKLQLKKRIIYLVENCMLKQLIKTLKKNKLFSTEKGMLKEITNKEKFLVQNKMKYSETEHDKKFTMFEIAIKSILNKL